MSIKRLIAFPWQQNKRPDSYLWARLISENITLRLNDFNPNIGYSGY